jgi:hypothetical protein
MPPSTLRGVCMLVYAGLTIGALDEIKDTKYPSHDSVGSVTVCEKGDLVSFPGPNNEKNHCLIYTGYDTNSDNVLDIIKINDGSILYREDKHPDFDDITARLE